MREIQFRAYLDDFEEMFYRAWIVESQLYVDLDGKPWDVLDLDDRVHVMQYTGLKDLHGNEIYDGDIVECYAGEHYQGYWEYQNRVVVEYCWTQSMWEMLNCDQLEVIGNIYEHPERIPEVPHA